MNKITKLRKIEKPSQIIQSRITALEKEAVAAISQKMQLSEEETRQLLANDVEWNKIMGLKEKEFKLMILTEIVPRIREAVDKKIDSGSLEQMLRGFTALSIAKDKVFDQGKAGINVSGQNIQINLKGWKFKARR